MKLSIKQASQKMNVSEMTLRNWIKAGKIEAQKEGKSWKISETSLENYMTGKAGKHQAEPSLTEEAFSQLASKVVAELKPVLEQAFAIQQNYQAKTTELDSRVTKLEKELAELKQSQAKQDGGNEKQGKQPEQPNKPMQEVKPPIQPNAAKQEARQPNQSKAKPVSQAGKADQPDEEKAEKWTRENLNVWLDQPCPYGKAQGRTWRDLAANKGEKISLKGVESVPRAYLHAIENWQDCESVWTKMKAKIALEVVETSGHSHYGHPVEIGG